MQEKIETVSNNIHEQNGIFDSKVFQLLINTIAILGIFVAIAFAGFGGTSFLTNITIDLSDDFFGSVFYLFLVALFVYNILLLLLYFVFVILRNFYTNNNLWSLKFMQRLTSSKLSMWKMFQPLFIVDIILFAITIALFFVVLFFIV